MREQDGVYIWGDEIDDATIAQIKNADLTGACHKAIMADGHVGYGVPIGGVVAYHDIVCVSGVGYDIACGNKAVLLDVPAQKVKANIHRYMDEIAKKISFGMGRSNQEEIEIFTQPNLFDYERWKHIPILKEKYDRAVSQLGTVGGGNHYVDIFVDELDRVWVGVHFGSRGLGHGIAQHYIDIAKAKSHYAEGIAYLHDRSEAGLEYLECMAIAGEYAYAGRDWVCGKVARILGGKILDEVHNHHNFCWREKHGDDELWVVRKGATPAFPGQRGFIGGSMCESAVIVEGIENEFASKSLYSTVHGAGRLLSRSKAKGNPKKNISGAVSRRAMDKSVEDAGVVLRGADVDEAMQCYKRLPEVLKAHEGTINILHTLKPIGVAMASPDIRDPFKD